MGKFIPSKTVFLFPLFFLLALLVFWPTFKAPPLWDDNLFLFHSAVMKEAPSPLVFWPGGKELRSWPLFYSLNWVLLKAWGDNFPLYHLFNILLHTLNAFLLFLVLRSLKITAALLAAILFLVHPLNMESVAWIIQNKTILSLTFLLLSAGLFIKFYQSHKFQNFAPKASRAGVVFYGLSLGFFLCSLLTKSTTAPFPLFLLLFLFSLKRGETRQTLIKCIKWTFPFFLLSGFSFLLTIRPLLPVETLKKKGRSLSSVTVRPPPLTLQAVPLEIPQRLILIMKTHFFYVKKILRPFPLLLIYPKFNLEYSARNLFMVLLFLLLLPPFLFHLLRKSPELGWSLFFFLVMIFPLSGPFTIPYFRWSHVSDHWAYLPALGLIVFFSLLLERLPSFFRSSFFKTTLITVLVLSSSLRAQDYADEDYLFLQSLEHLQYPEREMVQEILYFYYIGRMKYYKVSGDQARLAEWDRRTNMMFFTRTGN